MGLWIVIVQNPRLIIDNFFKEFNKFDIHRVRIENGEQNIVENIKEITIKIHSSFKLIFDI